MDKKIMGKIRNSKLELLRIVSMLLIIMNHYCVNIDVGMQETPYQINNILKVVFGSWGG